MTRRGKIAVGSLALAIAFVYFLVVVVTAGSVKVFGHMIMDPVEIVARIDNKVAVFIGSVTFIIATMGINIVANFVSPAYDIARRASVNCWKASHRSIAGA